MRDESLDCSSGPERRDSRLDPPYRDSDDPQNKGGGNDPAFYRPARLPLPTTYPDDLPCAEKAVRECEEVAGAGFLTAALNAPTVAATTNNTEMGLPWRVDYDGPSRPIILTSHVPPRMFSFDELCGGTKCGSFDGESEWCERIAAAVNTRLEEKESK